MRWSGTGKRSGPRRWRLLLLPPALALGLWIPGNLAVTVTPSVRHRIFWLKAADNGLRAGDYLLFEMEHPWSDRVEDRMIKEIGCAPGQVLETRGSGYYCDGGFLGEWLPADSTGRRLEHFHFQGRVPAGHFFMRGHHPRSYDSRYYGFITHERIRAKAIPLL